MPCVSHFVKILKVFLHGPFNVMLQSLPYVTLLLNPFSKIIILHTQILLPTRRFFVLKSCSYVFWNYGKPANHVIVTMTFYIFFLDAAYLKEKILTVYRFFCIFCWKSPAVVLVRFEMKTIHATYFSPIYSDDCNIYLMTVAILLSKIYLNDHL